MVTGSFERCTWVHLHPRHRGIRGAAGDGFPKKPFPFLVLISAGKIRRDEQGHGFAIACSAFHASSKGGPRGKPHPSASDDFGKEIVDDSILNNGSAAANPRNVESQHNRDDHRIRKQSSGFHKSPSRYPSQSTLHFFIHKQRLVRNQSDFFNGIGHQKSEPAGPQQFRPASPNLFGGWQ